MCSTSTIVIVKSSVKFGNKGFLRNQTNKRKVVTKFFYLKKNIFKQYSVIKEVTLQQRNPVGGPEMGVHPGPGPGPLTGPGPVPGPPTPMIERPPPPPLQTTPAPPCPDNPQNDEERRQVNNK